LAAMVAAATLAERAMVAALVAELAVAVKAETVASGAECKVAMLEVEACWVVPLAVVRTEAHRPN